ncbi:MAG: ADP-ribosylation factor-directed GTPase activating protein isoform b [Planctomycetota bacterium]|nr:MAG: ADP-ribosylation factor-directed GTPase activating protein isoform b [Planctomycetota bacterium]
MGSGRFALVGIALFAGLGLVTIAGCSKPQPQVAETPLPDDEQLKERLDRAIAFTRDNRHLNTKDQAAWQIVHGALAYGRDFEIYHDGQLVPAIDYLLGGGALRGWQLRKGDHGLEAVLDAGSKTGQGHEDQWLGYLSQVGLEADDEIKVGDETYQVRDLVTQAQWDLYDGMEGTWTLMGFTRFLPPDAEWTAKDGSKWTLDRLARMEAEQNLADSACGGTHRMYALAVALDRYLEQGGELGDDPDGTWEKVDAKIQDAVKRARENQQPDGSFSVNYFSRAAASAEIDARISSSGHVLEFLMVALDDEQIQEPWVTRAVLHLVDCLEKTQKFDLECGALYHAVHGLKLYRERRFGPVEDAAPEQPVAAQASADGAGVER